MYYIHICVDLVSALQYTYGVWAQTLLDCRIHDCLLCGSNQIFKWYEYPRAFCACHGRAVKTSPVVLQISFLGGLVPSHISVYRWLIWVKLRRSDTKVISASVAFQISTTEAVLVRNVLMHASIVLFGIWTFFSESYALVPLVWEQKPDLHIYIYRERERETESKERNREKWIERCREGERVSEKGKERRRDRKRERESYVEREREWEREKEKETKIYRERGTDRTQTGRQTDR